MAFISSISTRCDCCCCCCCCCASTASGSSTTSSGRRVNDPCACVEHGRCCRRASSRRVSATRGGNDRSSTGSAMSSVADAAFPSPGSAHRGCSGDAEKMEAASCCGSGCCAQLLLLLLLSGGRGWQSSTWTRRDEPRRRPRRDSRRPRAHAVVLPAADEARHGWRRRATGERRRRPEATLGKHKWSSVPTSGIRDGSTTYVPV